MCVRRATVAHKIFATENDKEGGEGEGVGTMVMLLVALIVVVVIMMGDDDY